jgi:predicted Zn-dependent protease
MPASCANTFDLQSVAAHERGHTVGLNHVDQATHAVETMSPQTRPCDVSKRLLAGGDLAGMTALYAK